MPALTAGRTLSGLQRRMVLRSLLALGATAVVPAGTRAAVTATATTEVHGSAAAAPAAIISSFENTLISIMKAGKTTPFVQRFSMLAPSVDQTFDLQTILRNSVGLQWASLQDQQKQKLLTTFRRYTIATWVANFDSYSGQKFTVGSSLKHVGDEVVVPTDLVPQNGSPTNLSYVMRQIGDQWKVVDVLAEGSISRVAVQRSDFRSLLTNGGVPALVASLQKKIASLSDGSLA